MRPYMKLNIESESETVKMWIQRILSATVEGNQTDGKREFDKWKREFDKWKSEFNDLVGHSAVKENETV